MQVDYVRNVETKTLERNLKIQEKGDYSETPGDCYPCKILHSTILKCFTKNGVLFPQVFKCEF